MENKVILNSTELTGIMNRDEMNKLSLVIEEKSGMNIERNMMTLLN